MRTMRYAEEWIERVRAESDILQVVSEYVSLQRKGQRYWGLCPFHGEKSPSFSVAPDKGFYYCFGCQSGGNIFQFVMQMDNVPFKEAARKVANKFGIPLPEIERTPEEEAKDRLKKSLYEVNAQAARYFAACLGHDRVGKDAREYLARREIPEELQKKFQLGYAPNSWQHARDALLKKGFSPEALEAAGLVGRNKQGGLYERFRGGLMDPISDPRGRVIGFGGRILVDKEGDAKYLNSPETTLFNKRHQLYGLNFALDTIKQTKRVFIVEGYMDLLALHKAGVTDSVASLGTAFTSQQSRLIQRSADEVIFAYDSDSAGQNATIRALEVVREQGLQVRILAMPDGKDPDEFIRSHGVEEFRKLQGLSLLEYRLNRILLQGEARGPTHKQETVEQIVAALADSKDMVEVEEQIRVLAQQLQLDEGVLRKEIQRFARRGSRPEKKVDTSALERDELPVAKTEREVLAFLAKEESARPYVATQLAESDFSKAVRGRLFALLTDPARPGPLSLSVDAEEESREWYRIDGEERFMPEDPIPFLDRLIQRIRLDSLSRQLEEASQKAEEERKQGNENFLQELQKSQRILQEIQSLKNQGTEM